MLLRLFLLFTLVPLVELTVLVWIGQRTNWVVTLALIFVPGLVGAWLAKREGLRCLHSARQQMMRGEVPATSLLDGLLVLVAGVLLITPGLLSDVLGLLLLIPPIRRAVRLYVALRIRKRVVSSMAAGSHGPPDRIIDVRVVEPERRDSDEWDR